MAGPYYTNSKKDDIDFMAEVDLEAIETGFSNVDTDIQAKEDTITGAASTITSADLTADRAVITNGSGKIAVSAATAAEVAYLSGLASNAQAQITANTLASNHTYTPSGAGAVPTDVETKLQDIRSIIDFGGAGDGATDNLAAFNLAKAAAGSYGAVYFTEGTFNTSGTLDSQNSGLRIYGAGRAVTEIRGTGDFDVFHFHAPTASASTPIYDSSVADLSIGNTTTTSTSVGLRVSRVTAFTLSNVHIGDHQKGLLLEGTAQGNFVNLTVSASGHTGATIDDFGLITLNEYQDELSAYHQVWTTNFTNLMISGANKAKYCIRVQSTDGVTFNGAYLAQSVTALISFNESANSHLAAISFSNVIGDGVFITAEAVNIAASAGSEESAIIKFDGCSFGQCDDGFILGTEVKSFSLTDTAIINIPGYGVNVTDAANGSELTFNGVRLAAVGTDASKAGIRINAAGAVIMSAIHFTGISGAGSYAIQTAGTITGLTLSDAHFKDCTDDIDNSASYTDGFVHHCNMTDNASIFKPYGEWTATLTAGTGTITLDPTKDTMAWDRIGRKIFFQGQVTVSAISSPSGTLRLGGLPVPADSSITESADIAPIYIRAASLSGSVNALQGRIVGGGTSIVIEEFDGTTAVDDVANHMKIGTTIAVAGHYIAADV